MKPGVGRIIVNLCIAFIFIISSGLWFVPVDADDGSGSGSKVNSLLDMHIKVKKSYTASGSNSLQGSMAPLELAGSTIGISSDISNERVYVHLAQQPSATQVSELQQMGLIVYPDSWIPPVGKFKDGFILADMPVDKLDEVASKHYVISLNTAERTLSPQCDLAKAAMNIGDVWSSGDNGSGITVAVIDSGLDMSQGDIPTPVASKDYSNYPILDDTIANTWWGHGTHVSALLLGRGVGNASYKGSAPGASLVFLKVQKDDGSFNNAAIVAALKAAVDVYHVRIINLSLGGLSEYHDGSDELSQAVDYATSKGASVFCSAGNDGDTARHYSGTLPAGCTTDYIQIDVLNTPSQLFMGLVWYDSLGTHNRLSLKYFNSEKTELSTIWATAQSESVTSGTESKYSWSYIAQPVGTYYLKVQNTSANNQFFHIYCYTESDMSVVFKQPDPAYTIITPAESDSAIAVGAYVTRTSWTNYLNNSYSFVPAQTLNSIATFSGRGPRVDAGAPRKPNIVAPGSAIICARDSLIPLGHPDWDWRIIKNVPPNDGGLPASYFVAEGTSLSSPLAAGVGVLILAKHPTWTPSQVRQALETTATDKGTTGPDDIYGWGLINAFAAAINNVKDAGIGTNLGRVSFSTDKGSIGGLTHVKVADTRCSTPAGYDLPYGLFSFNITNLAPGNTVNITIKFPRHLPNDAKYFKCINGRMVDFTSRITRLDAYTLVLSLTDGGFGDADGIANGTIVDPGGPAELVATAQGYGQGMIPSTPQAPVILPSIAVKSASLSATKVSPGTPVTLTANVANTGAVNGTSSIKVYVNGELENSQGVTVSSGSSTTVTFTVSRNEPGTYSVYVGGTNAGNFTVDQFTPDAILIISCALIFFAFVLGLIYVTRRRACQ